MRIIDTHCHYNDDQIYPIVDEVITRAKAAGVQAIFNNGDSLASFTRILELQERYPDFCHSVLGIHPEHAAHDQAYFEESYRQIKNNIDKISAIGEIGLDYHYSKDPEYVQAQKFRFIEQIRLAKELHLPIVVHSRDADFDTLDIIRQELPEKVDLHCYSGSVEIAREYLKLPIDFRIGVGGVCTFKNARVIKEVIQYCSEKIILTETDAPYLAPTPHRGQMNESSYIPLIFEAIASLKMMDVEELAEKLYQQGLDFYGLSK
jgi:TatD DNase family protein